MEIIKTNILDLKLENKDDLNQAKLNLAENIINYVYPILDEDYSERNKDLRKLKKKLKEKKVIIGERKDILENLQNEYNKKLKTKKLLDRLEKLIDSKLIYMESSTKKETIILLKILNSLNETHLDYHLNNTVKILSKRV